MTLRSSILITMESYISHTLAGNGNPKLIPLMSGISDKTEALLLHLAVGLFAVTAAIMKFWKLSVILNSIPLSIPARRSRTVVSWHDKTP